MTRAEQHIAADRLIPELVDDLSHGPVSFF
jgi:hypothetical protein